MVNPVVANPSGLVGVSLLDTSGNSVTLTGGNVPVSVTGTSTSTNAVPYVQSCGYTVISTIGTTTVKGSAGAFFGIDVITVGTAAVNVQAFDGATAITGTFTQSTANALLNILPPGVGIRFSTSLVIVTSGTAATINALWD